MEKGNISTKPTYGVVIFQVIHHARICSRIDDLMERVKSLTTKTTTETLHNQWFQVITEEMSEETSLDHYQIRPKTSPEPHRRIMINILGILFCHIMLYLEIFQYEGSSQHTASYKNTRDNDFVTDFFTLIYFIPSFKIKLLISVIPCAYLTNFGQMKCDSLDLCQLCFR